MPSTRPGSREAETLVDLVGPHEDQSVAETRNSQCTGRGSTVALGQPQDLRRGRPEQRAQAAMRGRLILPGMRPNRIPATGVLRSRINSPYNSTR
ncbi:hypothetical protein ACFV98_30660 [Streptomyces violascens]|uniref:hypothetical protein n=1 Tax=Streptomyces violascens TaxID=67381 RepID=UPI00364C219A